MSTIKIYSPEGQADVMAGLVPISPNRGLRGRRIAVLDNGKAGANCLIGRMAETLAKENQAEFVGVFRKGTAATPCEADLMDQLVAKADVILTGTAD